MTDISYDEETFSLKGEVNWPTDYCGTRIWEYCLTFSPDFSEITKGVLYLCDHDRNIVEVNSLNDTDIHQQRFKSRVINQGVIEPKNERNDSGIDSGIDDVYRSS